jgi:hypothetical protein
LKCQQCQLPKKVFLTSRQTFHCVSLNSKLKFRHTLADMKGNSKTSDVFAIQLF